MELVHGGDWAGYRAEFGRDALDFSANVSPLGLPAGVAAAITAALPRADRYPDPLCRALRTKLAAAEGVDSAQILCGNGAADLIYRLHWPCARGAHCCPRRPLPSTLLRWKRWIVTYSGFFCGRKTTLP